MANASKADVIDKLAHTSYAAEFRNTFGANIFDNPDDAFDQTAIEPRSRCVHDARVPDRSSCDCDEIATRSHK